MTGKPDTITISAEHTADIAATGAELFLSVTGASRVRANEAKAKASEVNDLVGKLAAVGVSQDQIEVQGVSFGSSKGRLTSSSHAIYALRVGVEELDRLPQIFDAVADSSNTTLDRITWRYQDEDEHAAALKAALAKARAKAVVVAQALAVELLAVHDFTESGHDSEVGPATRGVAMSAPEQAPSLDLSIQHTKRRFVRVEITYRVGA